MSKRVEQIKNQLMLLAEAINAFRSEAVQTRVVDWVIQVLMQDKTANPEYPALSITKAKPIKPGATKILNQILLTDFFDTPHSIAEIVDHGNNEFDADIKASEVSGVLLQLVKKQRLIRSRSGEHNNYQYNKL
ncbi:hypothetical protein [Mucilaginibacter aquaedulcis]|uniref:hypothetical protein n=1 Tax=Mucilaginibacter aquaedulcis TaxID=1187081 RepID=UPI0025B5BF36|nr:hypothetical protein [Mucilaginibacter aquaedulcis]MDN3551247.1 hypothetical protein [Mucilaginibacter aquaedulcis]